MSNTYLAHHGVKGMKWGVRRERRAANRAKRRAASEAYKREIASPGSQSKEAVSTRKLSNKKIKNVAGMVVLGRESVTDLLTAGAMGTTAAGVLASGGAASVAAGLVAGSLTSGAIGVAAGIGAYKTYKRAQSINTSLQLRDNPKDPKARARAAAITRERASGEQKRRGKADAKTYKQDAKAAGLKYDKNTAKNIRKGATDLKSTQRDIQRKVRRKQEIEERATSRAALEIGEMRRKQAAGIDTKEDHDNFKRRLTENSDDYHKQLRELGFK